MAPRAGVAVGKLGRATVGKARRRMGRTMAELIAATRPDLAGPEPFRFGLLAAVPGLRHGVTRRDGPGLAGNLAFSRGPDPASVLAARSRWCQRIGVDPAGLVLARQVHGVHVERITPAERGRGALAAIPLPDADALATDAPGVALVVVSADCVPVVLVDPARRVAAVAHAGWRGMIAGVVQATVAHLVDWYGCRPPDLLAGVGPSIGPCCYAVGPEVARSAETRYGPGVLLPGPAPDNPRFDLWAAGRLALLESGLGADRIELADECTRCRNDLYFSHRAEGSQRGLFGLIVSFE
jgi:YfiH family protein